MTKSLYGERIGKTGKIAVGCNSVLFDSTQTRILLIRRSDNGRWALPGGFLEPGESVIEACEREAYEETGAHIRVKRLVGVYSDPHHVTEYPDGKRYYFVTLCFEGEFTEEKSGIMSPEIVQIGCFSRSELEQMDVIESQLAQINDAFADLDDIVVR